jgi:hypothetical protein
MQPLFESLEGRTLMSVSPVALQSAERAQPALVTIVPFAIPKIVAKYKGTISIPGIHAQSVTITIKKETATGKLTGTLVANADPSIVVKVTGKVTASRKVTLVLTGSHSGGSINGTGTGKLSANGKTMTISMVFVQGGMNFNGTLTLKRV